MLMYQARKRFNNIVVQDYQVAQKLQKLFRERSWHEYASYAIGGVILLLKSEI